MVTFTHTIKDTKGKINLLENEVPAGEIIYVWAGAQFIINHTEVYEGFNGKGYGKELVYKAIEYAKEKNGKIIPLCPYAKKIMERDEELNKML